MEENFIMVGHIFFPLAACLPSQISQSEVRLRNGLVACESCLLKNALGRAYLNLI